MSSPIQTITKPFRLKNRNCIYCGLPFDEGLEFDIEHVIGRKFVPKNSLKNQWNLIAKACKGCNSKKSQLEDDISAITILRAARRDPNDPMLRAEVARKLKPGGAASRFTGKPVARSDVQRSLSGTLMDAATFSFTFSGPPHIDPSRELELALFHVQAFYYLTTYNEENCRGELTPGLFAVIDSAPKSDWGNPIQVDFQRRVALWSQRILATGAKGYFQIMIRRREPDPLWAWAVEWNGQFRICGLFGEEAEITKIVESLPPLQFKEAGPGAAGEVIRYRREIELAEADDILFCS